MENNNETQVRQLVENWAKAVNNKDYDAILAHHSPDIVMYDVPEPFQSVGIDAYKKTWDLFFSCSQTVFEIRELHIVAGETAAFCYAAMQCLDGSGGKGFEPLDFRLTIGLKKINGQWTILHEHHSIPAK